MRWERSAELGSTAEKEQKADSFQGDERGLKVRHRRETVDCSVETIR